MVMNFALYDTNLHMLHHYKRINSAKKVVNTSAPVTPKRKCVSSSNSRYSTPSLLSASNKYASRTNSHCEVRKKRNNYLKNEPTSSERSSSVPPRPHTRRNAATVPLNYLTSDNSFSKIGENCKENLTNKKNEVNYVHSSSNSSVTSSPKHVKEKLLTTTKKDTVKRPIPTPRSIISEHKSISLEDYEYLQFSLRITEDIIRNDLYSQKEMRRVFNSHLEANRGRLSMRKMLQQIDHLCKELNLSKKAMDRVSKCTSISNSYPTTDKCCEIQSKKEQLMQKINSGHMLKDEEIFNLSAVDLEEVLNTILNSCQCDNSNYSQEHLDIDVLKHNEMYNCRSDEKFESASGFTSQSYTPKEQVIQESYRSEENVSVNNSKSIISDVTSLQKNIDSNKMEDLQLTPSTKHLRNVKLYQHLNEIVEYSIDDMERKIIETCENCRRILDQEICKNNESIQKILGKCDSCKFICSFQNSCREDNKKDDMLQGIEVTKENPEIDQNSDSCKMISTTKIDQLMKSTESKIYLKSSEEFGMENLNDRINNISLISKEIESQPEFQQIVPKVSEMENLTEKNNQSKEGINENGKTTKLNYCEIVSQTNVSQVTEIQNITEEKNQSKESITENGKTAKLNYCEIVSQTNVSQVTEIQNITEEKNQSKESITENGKIAKLSNEEIVSQTEFELIIPKMNEIQNITEERNQSKESITENGKTAKLNNKEMVSQTEFELIIPKVNEIQNITEEKNQSKEQISLKLESKRSNNQEDGSVENISALIKQLKERSEDNIQEILQIKQTSQHRISSARTKTGNKEIFQQTENTIEEQHENESEIIEKQCSDYMKQNIECKTDFGKVIPHCVSQSVQMPENIKDNFQFCNETTSELVAINLEEVKHNQKENSSDVCRFEINSIKSTNMADKANMSFQRHTEYENRNDITKTDLISSITKFILDKTFSRISSSDPANVKEYDFVSAVQKVVNDQTDTLYDYYIPENKFTSESDIMENIFIESLDKYQINNNGFQQKIEIKRRKSSSSSFQTISADLSKTSIVSSISKRITQIPAKKPNILQYLEKYEQNREPPKHVLQPCVCDYELTKQYNGNLYDNYIPKYSRSKFFPAVSTQTSNTDFKKTYRGFSSNLLSDGEIECCSDGKTDISDSSSR